MVVRRIFQFLSRETYASSRFLQFYSDFSTLRAKMEQFEIKMVSHQDEKSTSIDPKNISRWFQMTTRVFQHMFGIIGIRESKRYGHTTNISISVRGNVSYGAFLRVQKGSERLLTEFYEELSKNTQKSNEIEKTS